MRAAQTLVAVRMQYRWWPALLAVGLYLALTVAALVGAHVLDLEHGTTPAGSSALAMSWPGVWARWDSGFYVNIAENGYKADDGTPLYYPLYPFLIRFFSTASGLSGITGGTLLSVLFAAVSFVLLYQIISRDYGTDIGRITVILIALFPLAFFFFSVYTEALFLLLSVLAYSLARYGQWKWAVVVCLIAGFSRYNGFVISILVAVEFLTQKGYGRRYWFQSLLFLVPGFVGFLLYQVYLWAAFGDLLLSFKIQREIGQRYVTWPWISVWDTLQLAITGKGVEGNWFWRLIGWQELFYTGLFILLAIGSWRRLRPSLAAYVSISLVMFVASHGPHGMGLMSMPRYLLPLFPAYVVMAFVLRGHPWRWAVLIVSGILLIGYTIWFGSGRWVA